MKLTPASHLLLGMIRLGRQSGYGIKQATDLSTKNWWPMSLAKVYPELAKLEDAGLITGRDDPRGARARRSYELTASGEAALVEWLRGPKFIPPQVRDERLLRLFFADALQREDQVALVRRLREAHEAEVARIHEVILPITGAAAAAGTVFPAAVAKFSLEVFTAAARALQELETELSRDAQSE